MSGDDGHSAACTREMRARGQYAAGCAPCEAWARDVQAFIDTDPPAPAGPIAETPVRRLIALPADEVAALRAKAAAADRVRELADALGNRGHTDGREIRRALDGDGS